MKSLYSKLGIKYQQEYSGPYHDLSISTEYARLVCAKKSGCITGFGRPIVCFGDTKKGLKFFKKIYKACQNIWYLDLTGVDAISRFLLESGYKPDNFYAQVIDLSKPLPELHAEMRKSYQNLANKYTAKVSNYSEHISKLKELHKSVVGFQTRPDATWDTQKAMIENNEAFIVHSPSWDSAGLFIYNQESCYYGVGKSLGDTVSHPVLWKAICYAKKLGCKEFEMGQQIFSGDKKEVGISTFKRGFGGKTKIRLEFRTF